MDGRRERCSSINGLTIWALNSFGNAWPSSFSVYSRRHAREDPEEENLVREKSRNLRATEDGTSTS